MEEIEQAYPFDVGFPHNMLAGGPHAVKGPQDNVVSKRLGHIDYVQAPRPIPPQGLWVGTIVEMVIVEWSYGVFQGTIHGIFERDDASTLVLLRCPSICIASTSSLFQRQGADSIPTPWLQIIDLSWLITREQFKLFTFKLIIQALVSTQVAPLFPKPLNNNIPRKKTACVPVRSLRTWFSYRTKIQTVDKQLQ